MYLVHWLIVGEGTSGGFLQSHVWNIVTGGGVGGFMETPPITDSWGVESEFKAIGRKFLLLGGNIEVAGAVILKPGHPTTWSKSRNLRSPVPPSRWSWQGRPLKGEVFAAAYIMLFRICGALEDRCNWIKINVISIYLLEVSLKFSATLWFSIKSSILRTCQ